MCESEEFKKKIRYNAAVSHLLSLVHQVKHFALKCQASLCECDKDAYCGCASYMYCKDMLEVLDVLEDEIKETRFEFIQDYP